MTTRSRRRRWRTGGRRADRWGGGCSGWSRRSSLAARPRAPRRGARAARPHHLDPPGAGALRGCLLPPRGGWPPSCASSRRHAHLPSTSRSGSCWRWRPSRSARWPSSRARLAARAARLLQARDPQLPARRGDPLRPFLPEPADLGSLILYQGLLTSSKGCGRPARPQKVGAVDLLASLSRQRRVRRGRVRLGTLAGIWDPPAARSCSCSRPPGGSSPCPPCWAPGPPGCCPARSPAAPRSPRRSYPRPRRRRQSRPPKAPSRRSACRRGAHRRGAHRRPGRRPAADSRRPVRPGRRARGALSPEGSPARTSSRSSTRAWVVLRAVVGVLARRAAAALLSTLSAPEAAGAGFAVARTIGLLVGQLLVEVILAALTYGASTTIVAAKAAIQGARVTARLAARSAACAPPWTRCWTSSSSSRRRWTGWSTPSAKWIDDVLEWMRNLASPVHPTVHPQTRQVGQEHTP